MKLVVRLLSAKPEFNEWDDSLWRRQIMCMTNINGLMHKHIMFSFWTGLSTYLPQTRNLDYCNVYIFYFQTCLEKNKEVNVSAKVNKADPTVFLVIIPHYTTWWSHSLPSYYTALYHVMITYVIIPHYTTWWSHSLLCYYTTLYHVMIPQSALLLYHIIPRDDHIVCLVIIPHHTTWWSHSLPSYYTTLYHVMIT